MLLLPYPGGVRQCTNKNSKTLQNTIFLEKKKKIFGFDFSDLALTDLRRFIIYIRGIPVAAR